MFSSRKQLFVIMTKNNLMYLHLQIKTGSIEFDKVRKYHIFILFSRGENAREKVKSFRKGQHCLGRFGLLIRVVAGTVSGD
jgi:hypothetical protein